jgi:CRP/FNR family cyclic AMP-dependent transcriptional regulator
MAFMEVFMDPASALVFLADWDDHDWDKLLAHTEIRRFRAGEMVIRAGESDRTLYIVAEGRLEVLLGDAGVRRIAIIETGSVVGEQVFLDGQPRSASVRALTDVKILRLSVEAFEVFAAHEPQLGLAFLFDLARILSLRLRQTTALITAVS